VRKNKPAEAEMSGEGLVTTRRESLTSGSFQQVIHRDLGYNFLRFFRCQNPRGKDQGIFPLKRA